MDDLTFGTRNKRGDWTPHATVELPPLCAWPPRPLETAEVAAEHISFLERVPHGDGAGLLVLRRAGCRDHEDAELGLGALALCRECRGDLRYVWLGRAVLLRAAQAGNAVQVQRQVSRPTTRPTSSGSRARTSTTSCAASSSRSRCWTLVEVLLLWCFANGYVPWLSWADHPGLSGGARPCRADDPRGAFLLHPPADPRAAALQVDPLGSPQLDQSLALVVAVDAPGRGLPLSRRGALAPRHPVEPDRRAVPAASSPASARSMGISASTSSRSPKRPRSIATPTRTTCTTNISR